MEIWLREKMTDLQISYIIYRACQRQFVELFEIMKITKHKLGHQLLLLVYSFYWCNICMECDSRNIVDICEALFPSQVGAPPGAKHVSIPYNPMAPEP